jgi:hypothetical protein
MELYFACLAIIVLTVHAMNKTSPMTNEPGNDDADNDESFYTVDVLLTAGGVFPPKTGYGQSKSLFPPLIPRFSQNDTGLSIRLTARDGTVSAWHRLYASEDSNYFGQRSYILPSSTRDLGVISSVAIRVDKPELAASSMPYYLCIHGTANNNTSSENWNGCAYMQPPVGSKNGGDQQYPLHNANGKLI